ncbi:cobalamin biosynthesis protein [Streptomyces sp. MAR4 CNX-425]|uniref:cobalamin biosynthesis protein n=1 Tax=Streptomyces sp. MAR4 CNX-425 TaxID=3406343 RepID=UPI003B502043
MTLLATSRPRSYALGAALGYVADHLVGDPRRAHPVAAFGRAAAALEGRLWRDTRAAGALHTGLCVGGTVAAAALAAAAAARGRARRAAGAGGAPAHDTTPAPLTSLTALTALTTWSVLGGASLRREALGIAHALRAHRLADARRRLPRLCGRDPDTLGEADIARAVVESVAENTSDAVVGALVWGAVAGVPGLAGFRAVNTLDAMVGHRSARYLRFGWAAARLDDLVGYPGARLTAALAALAGPAPAAALRAWRRDGPRHPSPNAGPVEAAFAGALGLRLGGELSYGGRTEHRAVLNPGGRAPDAGDIERAVRLSARVCALALLTTAGAALLRTPPATTPTEASRA